MAEACSQLPPPAAAPVNVHWGQSLAVKWQKKASTSFGRRKTACPLRQALVGVQDGLEHVKQGCHSVDGHSVAGRGRSTKPAQLCARCCRAPPTGGSLHALANSSAAVAVGHLAPLYSPQQSQEPAEQRGAQFELPRERSSARPAQQYGAARRCRAHRSCGEVLGA